MSKTAHPELTLEKLAEAVRDPGKPWIRCVLDLDPGRSKIMPPTYDGQRKNDPPVYLFEKRYHPRTGKLRKMVVLDSMASQANRAEQALRSAKEAGAADFPAPSVAIPATDASGPRDLSTLDLPHRLFDAVVRDSQIDGVDFEKTDVRKALNQVTPDDYSAVYRVDPASLVFGYWDSTGPRGGLGSDSARAYVSEILGVGAKKGKRSASRVDPLGLEREGGVTFYVSKDESEPWTTDKEKSLGGKTLKPSHVNHGNVTPSLWGDNESPHPGGVSVKAAVQEFTLSLGRLREMGFGPDNWGEAAAAARTALAALGLLAFVEQNAAGYHLRSGCALAQNGEADLTIRGRTDSDSETFSLTSEGARRLLAEAAAAAKAVGIGWNDESLKLTPKKAFAEKIRDNDAGSLRKRHDSQVQQAKNKNGEG